MIEKILLPERFESKKLKIGITGGIGSGKSLFCSVLNTLGYPVLFADRIAKEVMQSDKALIAEIKENFGEESYLGEQLNRPHLASIVFNNPDQLKKLNSIVHPRSIQASSQLMNEKLLHNNFVFYEAALIFEAQMQNLFDAIIVILADEQKRIERIRSRDGIEENDIRLRMNAQIKDYSNLLTCGIVVNNSGSEDAFRSTAHSILKELQSRIF